MKLHRIIAIIAATAALTLSAVAEEAKTQPAAKETIESVSAERDSLKKELEQLRAQCIQASQIAQLLASQRNALAASLMDAQADLALLRNQLSPLPSPSTPEQPKK